MSCFHQKQESGGVSKVSRLKVWVKSRTKKDGTLVNMLAAEKFVSSFFLVLQRYYYMLSNIFSVDRKRQLRSLITVLILIQQTLVWIRFQYY